MPRPFTVRTRPSDLSISVARFTEPIETPSSWDSDRAEGSMRPASYLPDAMPLRRIAAICSYTYSSL